MYKTKIKASIKNSSSAGFTLMEIVIVIALMVIAIGVTGDIVLTLIRSYTKTQVANDIEQNVNFVSLKMENELKNALDVVAVSPSNLCFSQRNGTNTEEICYVVESVSGVLSIRRYVNSLNGSLVTDNNSLSGVRVATCNLSNVCFQQLSDSPDVVRVRLQFFQASSNSNSSFTGDVSIDNTILVRGSY